MWILIMWWFKYRVFNLPPLFVSLLHLTWLCNLVKLQQEKCHWRLKAWGNRGGEDLYQIGFHGLWYRDCTWSRHRIIGIRWFVIGMMSGLRCGFWWNRIAIADGQEIFFFPKSRRPYLGTTQPCILWTTGETYPGSKGVMAWSWPLAPK